MSTNDVGFGYGTVSNEAEKLKNEIEVGKFSVDAARNRYAEELGGKQTVSDMRMLASVTPKTYKIPRKVKNEGRIRRFLKKIKILFALTDDIG